jgi:hypothetical protein
MVQNLQSYISSALATLAAGSNLQALYQSKPPLAVMLGNELEAAGFEYDFLLQGHEPCAGIHINLIDRQWQEEFWWGQAYLEVKISKLGPVYTSKKVMIQVDPGVEGAMLNTWRHLAAEKEAVAAQLLSRVAAAAGAVLLTADELSKEIDTGALPLNAQYRRWKPTVYAVFFENIIQGNIFTGDEQAF